MEREDPKDAADGSVLETLHGESAESEGERALPEHPAPDGPGTGDSTAGERSGH